MNRPRSTTDAQELTYVVAAIDHAGYDAVQA